MGKMRATQHNGRSRKTGKGFTPKHNDRNFDIETAKNIDPSRTPLNKYWSIGSGGWYRHTERDEKPTFEEVERKYYDDHFKPMYEAAKKRSEKRGQLKRMRPFEEWRQARQYVPEETYLQIGRKGDTVDDKTLHDCVRDYIKELNKWNKNNGKPFTILDVAYHFDEAVPQVHIRRVWHSINPETGIDEIGQNLALERAGVALPDPSSPVGKDNNRKMTLDAYMREKWLDICESHGLEIEREPEKDVKHNRSKEEYIDDKQKAKAAELDERERAVAEREAQVDKIHDADGTIISQKMRIRELNKQVAELEQGIDDIAEYKTWKAAKQRAEQAEKERQEQERQEQERRQKAAEAARKAETERVGVQQAQAAQTAQKAATEPPATDTERRVSSAAERLMKMGWSREDAERTAAGTYDDGPSF